MKKKIVDIRIGPRMTANDVIAQLGESGVFGAGRISRACDIIEEMNMNDWQPKIVTVFPEHTDSTWSPHSKAPHRFLNEIAYYIGVGNS